MKIYYGIPNISRINNKEKCKNTHYHFSIMEDVFKVVCVGGGGGRETIPMLYCDPNHRAIN
jgi:hypothetical protein